MPVLRPARHAEKRHPCISIGICQNGEQRILLRCLDHRQPLQLTVHTIMDCMLKRIYLLAWTRLGVNCPWSLRKQGVWNAPICGTLPRCGNCSINLYSRHGVLAASAPSAARKGSPVMDPGSRELQPRRAGVPQNNILHDVGVSGATGTQERRAWHRLDSRLAGGDTPREVMTGPEIGPTPSPSTPWWPRRTWA